MKQIISIFGPTGVGKTDFVNQLTEQCSNFEIVNADMGQMYVPLSIGTAKPDLRNVKVAHHLFNIIKTPDYYSVQKYQEEVKRVIYDIWNRDKVPVIVGGSGFYLKSLFFPICTIASNFNNNISDMEISWEKLNQIDPVRASCIHKNDIFRIERALKLFKDTGRLASENIPMYNPLSTNFILINLSRDREELYKRINLRVDQMLSDGWIREVENLNDDWKDFIRVKKIIGYDDILANCSQINNAQVDIVDTIKKKTRNYAKRQITFWNSFKKDILKFEPNANIKDINLTCYDYKNIKDIL